MKNTINRTALTLACAVALSVPALAAGTGGCADVPEGAWYAEAAAYCQRHGLLGGGEAGKFLPDAPMTRGMLADALYRVAGSPAGKGDNPFPDVEAGTWYEPAVIWTNQKGYMTGFETGNFGPEMPMTREQLAAVFWRYEDCPAVPAEDYADESAISSYAAGAVDWARSTGLMSGRAGNLFAPKEGASRAHMAKVLMNYTASSAPAAATQVSAMDVMCQPCGVAAMADGSLLVTDGYNKVIWRVADGKSIPYAGADTVEDPYGQPVGGYHDDTLPKSIFKDPWAVAPFLDGWAVSDTENNVVRFLRPAGDGKRTDVTDLGVRFNHPTGLAADNKGNLYVAETFQGAVKKVTPQGEVTTLASGLAEPMGLCWKDGILYVAESGGNRILKIDGNKNVSVVAGSGSAGSADGPAGQAGFSGPKGVAVDKDGTVYAADTDNGTIRKIQNGRVTTILSRDPRDIQALFPVSPTGLLIQGDTLYISDTFARKLLALPLR